MSEMSTMSDELKLKMNTQNTQNTQELSPLSPLSPWQKRSIEGRLPNRKRPIRVSIQMSEAEKKALDDKLVSSGLSMREFIQRAVSDKEISSRDDIKEIRDLSLQVADIQAQIRRIGNNLNQAVRIMHINNINNVDGTMIPTKATKDVENCITELDNLRKEIEPVWESLKQSTQKLSQE